MANNAEFVTLNLSVKESLALYKMTITSESLTLVSGRSAVGRFRNPWNAPFQTPTRYEDPIQAVRDFTRSDDKFEASRYTKFRTPR